MAPSDRLSSTTTTSTSTPVSELTMTEQKLGGDGETLPTTSWWADLRDQIYHSPNSGCARESFLWGIATGTANGIHRLRMGSHGFRAINFAFGTAMLVIFPSYYFCVKNREHKEKMIEIMMTANAFEPQEEMPEPIPLEQHPFLKDGSGSGSNSDPNNNDSVPLRTRVFQYFQKEKKDFEPPNLAARDASEVFQEVTPTTSKTTTITDRKDAMPKTK